jgi:aminoglycoside phosphotransferase (APT) family kinase protein
MSRSRTLNATVNCHDQIHAMLQACGLTAAGERPALTPLKGGVSSEIFRIDLPTGPVCAKRALRRLKVAQDWFAPVERSEAEVAWIQTVQSIHPGAAPRLIAADASHHGFVMAYLDPDQYPCWRDSLRDGAIDPLFAKAVGEVIGRIHARTARNGDVAAAFPNQALFEALRMEPYLRATATRHPDLAGRLNELAETTLGTRLVLMHGDVSPKNILQGPEGPVFLDSECACYGDPAFDLAFCMNHLLLKSVWQPQWRDRYMQCFESLFAGYVTQIDWERPAALEARAAGLLPALLLDRVDGKSPVEYINTDAQKAYVRRISRHFIAEPAAELGEIRDAWREGIFG